MYTLTTGALLQEYITDTLTRAWLPKSVRVIGDIDLDGQVLNITNRFSIIGDHVKSTRIICNGGNIRVNSTWVNLRDLSIVMSGGGCAVHCSYARMHADNVLINNDNSASRTKGTAFAFDSLSDVGAQVGGAYTSVVSNTHMNDGAQQSKHFASAVTYIPLTGISGTFQRGEVVTATGASAEVIAVLASAIKVHGAEGDFTGKTIAGQTSGATATGGAEVETQFNSHTFRDCNVIAPYPIHYRAGGGSKINGGQWQSGGASATGSLITQRGIASGFLLTGAPYIEKYQYIQNSDNGTNQYVHADMIWSDNNAANSNYPARFIQGGSGGGTSYAAGNGIDITGGVISVVAGANVTVDAGGISATGTLGLPTQIFAEYRSNAGQTIANNALTIVDFEDVATDSHSAVTTGASWKFTAPRAGKYMINGSVLFSNGGGWGSAETARVDIYKNGSLNRSVGWDGQDNAHGNYVRVPFSCVVDLANGDYIDARVFQNSGASLSLYANDTWNFISICEVR